MRHRLDWGFLTELAFAGLLIAIAFASDARASGIANILLGSGNNNSLSTTITVGEYINDTDGFVGYCAISEDCDAEIGTISVSAIPGGYTIVSVEELVESGVIVSARVIISGFSSSPGAPWLGAVTFNSNTFSGSSAEYSYAAGVATWSWPTSAGWAWADGDEYAGTVGYP